MTFFGFIQWCFRDAGSGLVTIFVAGMVLDGLIKLAFAFRGRE